MLTLVLPGVMFWRGAPAATEGLGPAAWPDAMLTGLAFFSALWLGREIWALRRAGRRSMLRPPDEDEPYSFRKALVGIALIVIYGWGMQIVGFALATAVFIALWCVYGGVRRPVVVLPVALIGTFALLWVFVGLALMPLSRGVGVFDRFSIWMLQICGIY